MAGWEKVNYLDEQETCLLLFTGMGAISGKGLRDTMVLGKGVVVFDGAQSSLSRFIYGERWFLGNMRLTYL